MVQQLLPVAPAAPRCSDFARSVDALPLGSGLCLDRVVLIAVPLPWPKPALAHPVLKPSVATIAQSSVPSRLFACEPWEAAAPETSMVEVFERVGLEITHVQWLTTPTDHVADLISAISTTPVGELETVHMPGVAPPVSTVVSTPTFLVCTQGTHDQCCGTAGVALADHLAQDRPEYTLRRVSHTGGHRFAPTLLAFPAARMWAFADLALVDRIASDTVTGDDVLTKSRGWLGAKIGPAQVAEAVARVARTEPWATAPAVAVEADGDRFRCAVVAPEETSVVDVHVAREIPSITCEAPGGLPAKPGREFGWTTAVAAQ